MWHSVCSRGRDHPECQGTPSETVSSMFTPESCSTKSPTAHEVLWRVLGLTSHPTHGHVRPTSRVGEVRTVTRLWASHPSKVLPRKVLTLCRPLPWSPLPLSTTPHTPYLPGHPDFGRSPCHHRFLDWVGSIVPGPDTHTSPEYLVPLSPRRFTLPYGDSPNRIVLFMTVVIRGLSAFPKILFGSTRTEGFTF